MHPCLKIPEIQLTIFTLIRDLEHGPFRGDMDRYGPNPIVQPTLAALARSCQQFHDTATNVLWETQTSLAPLMRVMPEDLWEWVDWDDADTGDPDWADVDTDEPLILSFTRAVRQSDWERYDHYSPKIRHVKLDGNTGITKDVVIRLSTYRPMKRLLPRLQSLKIGFLSDYVFRDYIPTLLSEGLQTVSISAGDPNDVEEQVSIQNLLLSIRGCCPNLTNLTLPYCERMVAATSPQDLSLHHVLSGLTSLVSVSLYLSDISPGVQTWLSSKTQLRSLSLHGSYSDHGFKALPFFQSKDLPIHSLELLEVYPSDSQTILISAPRGLKRLKVTHQVVNPTIIIDTSNIPWASFTDLVFLHLHYARSGQYDSNRESDALTRLLSLRNLQEVLLYGVPSTLLTNTWLEKLSVSWPNLHSLSLCQNQIEKPQMTLEGLIPISRNCLQLTFLKISLLCYPFELQRIVTGRHTGDPDRGGGGQGCVLRNLIFINSPLKRSLRVLRCISHLFPFVTDVSGHVDPEMLASKQWADPQTWNKFNHLLKEAFGGGGTVGKI